jgi:peptide/nickel transport system permease protein
VFSVLGPILTGDPFEMQSSAALQGPSLSHPFGTDKTGRDQLARVILGLRFSTMIAVAAVTGAVILGGLVGLLAGVYGGQVDNLLMRLLDILQAFPALLLAIMMLAALGPSVANLIAAMAVIFWPSIARLVRSEVLVLREREFVEAARALGLTSAEILRRHLLPNLVPLLIVAGTGQIATAVLTEASLGFLGLGVKPPDPSLGGMINSARPTMLIAPWLALFPGIAIGVLVIGFNLFGDALRDAFDPRLVSRYTRRRARRQS